MQRVFSSREIGQLVSADASSVNRWIDTGKIRAYRTPGGHRRVLHDDLVDFLDRCGMPLPVELRPTNRSILLVDDDALFLRSIRRSLVRIDRSLEISTSTSGIEALLMIGAHKPDVVVLDVMMPDIDGIEVCEKIKSNPETHNTTVIAITGSASAPLEKKVKATGASAFLAKPFKGADLLAIIRPTPRTTAS